MATIQIRGIPEDAYETIRKRAPAAGRSIQSYMRDVVVEFAGQPTTEEVLAAMASVRARRDTPGATHESILADRGQIDGERRLRARRLGAGDGRKVRRGRQTSGNGLPRCGGMPRT